MAVMAVGYISQEENNIGKLFPGFAAELLAGRCAERHGGAYGAKAFSGRRSYSALCV